MQQIILIDKDKDFVEALTGRLKICGFVTAGLTNGAPFFQLASQLAPSLLMLSDNLTNPNWSEMISRIKRTSFKNKIPLLLFYEENSKAIEQQCKIYQVKHLVQKPLHFQSFLHILRDTLETPS